MVFITSEQITLNTLLEELKDGYIAICSISNNTYYKHHNNYRDDKELKILIFVRFKVRCKTDDF